MPLLLKIFINDIFLFLEKSEVCNFADDNTIFSLKKHKPCQQEFCAVYEEEPLRAVYEEEPLCAVYEEEPLCAVYEEKPLCAVYEEEPLWCCIWRGTSLWKNY